MIEFEGNVYIRPLNRGICLGDDMEDFEDWVTRMLNTGSISAGGLDIRLRITIERLSDASPSSAAGGGEGAAS